MVDMVVHRHNLRATLARICHLLTRRRPGQDIAMSQAKDGKVAHAAPPSTITLSGNGLDKAALHEEEDAEDLTGSAGNGANPNPPQSV
jgi:hypothetical protein